MLYYICKVGTTAPGRPLTNAVIAGLTRNLTEDRGGRPYALKYLSYNLREHFPRILVDRNPDGLRYNPAVVEPDSYCDRIGKIYLIISRQV